MVYAWKHIHGNRSWTKVRRTMKEQRQSFFSLNSSTKQLPQRVLYKKNLAEPCSVFLYVRSVCTLEVVPWRQDKGGVAGTFWGTHAANPSHRHEITRGSGKENGVRWGQRSFDRRETGLTCIQRARSSRGRNVRSKMHLKKEMVECQCVYSATSVSLKTQPCTKKQTLRQAKSLREKINRSLKRAASLNKLSISQSKLADK